MKDGTIDPRVEEAAMGPVCGGANGVRKAGVRVAVRARNTGAL
jgi:hypothetical protein